MDLTNISSDLSKQFDGYKAQRDKATSVLAEVRQKARALLSEATHLRKAPITQEEFISVVQGEIGKLAEEGRKRQERILLMHTRGPLDGARDGCAFHGSQLQWDHLMDVADPCTDTGLGATLMTFLSAGNPRNYSVNPTLDAVALCTMLEDQLKAGAAKNIMAIEWPYPGNKPSAEREKRLAEIEADLKTCEATEAALVDLLARMSVA